MLSLAGTTESSMPASGAVLLPISAYADVTRAFPLCAIIGPGRSLFRCLGLVSSHRRGPRGRHAIE